MKIKIIENALSNALSKIGLEEIPQIAFEKPNNPDHGDISTNIALQLASILKNSPTKIAESILQNLEYDESLIEKVEIAGPGFINFKFNTNYFTSQLEYIRSKNEIYGQQDIGNGIRVNVEYVSANPTGLLHLGHGRNAAIGDTIANIYEWLGYDVTREYYFNNAGNQMNNLVNSIYVRYLNLFNDTQQQIPEDGYHGEYVVEIANDLYNEYREELKDGNYQDRIAIKKFGESWCFDKIKKTLTKMNIEQDVFYNEDSLYKEGKISDVINDLKEANLVYEKDGATWLKLSEMGLEDDRVIVKSSGEPTYRLPDIAYHKEKFKRGFDKIIDVFGADHIATIPDVMAAVKHLGYNTENIKVVIHQFVTLTKDGQQVKMSKRTGKSYTLDDLLDEVGSEVVRFFLIMRGNTTHLEFDLTLATENSDKNPVFYLKYAHARICSILENIENSDLVLSEVPDFSLLQSEEEINLIKSIIEFPDYIKLAADKYEPQIIVEYLREFASKFSTFYHSCRIKGEDEQILRSRLHLANIAKVVLKNGLSILGIKAPNKM
ncbi:MAG: arginine--tRNA ligase [Candidatus Kapaibacterium sp.]